jgi:hypothetical protein
MERMKNCFVLWAVSATVLGEPGQIYGLVAMVTTANWRERGREFREASHLVCRFNGSAVTGIWHPNTTVLGRVAKILDCELNKINLLRIELAAVYPQLLVTLSPSGSQRPIQ